MTTPTARARAASWAGIVASVFCMLAIACAVLVGGLVGWSPPLKWLPVLWIAAAVISNRAYRRTYRRHQ